MLWPRPPQREQRCPFEPPPGKGEEERGGGGRAKVGVTRRLEAPCDCDRPSPGRRGATRRSGHRRARRAAPGWRLQGTGGLAKAGGEDGEKAIVEVVQRAGGGRGEGTGEIAADEGARPRPTPPMRRGRHRWLQSHQNCPRDGGQPQPVCKGGGVLGGVEERRCVTRRISGRHEMALLLQQMRANVAPPLGQGLLWVAQPCSSKDRLCL